LADERGGVAKKRAAGQLPARVCQRGGKKGGGKTRRHSLTTIRHHPHNSKWHPDRNPDNKEKAEKRFKEVRWWEESGGIGVDEESIKNRSKPISTQPPFPIRSRPPMRRCRTTKSGRRMIG